MTNAHQSQGSVQPVSCYGNQQPSSQYSPIDILPEHGGQGNASGFHCTIQGQDLFNQGTSYVGDRHRQYHPNPQPNHENTTFQQTGMNLQGTPVRQEERNALPRLADAVVPVNHLNSPAGVSTLTTGENDLLELLEKEKVYFTERFFDTENVYGDMNYLIKSAVGTIISRVKFLDHEEAWRRPDFVNWLKKLENGQLAGVRGVSVPFYVTREVFKNWVGSRIVGAENSFTSNNLQTIVRFWRVHHQTVRKYFSNRRNNINGAVKSAFVQKLQEKKVLKPEDNDVRALTLEKVQHFDTDFECLVWYCSHCRVFRKKNSNMRKDIVTASDNMLRELAKRAFLSFLNDVVPAVINRKAYEKRYQTKGFEDIVTVSDEAWGLVVLEGWFDHFFQQHDETAAKREVPKFGHIDEVTLNKFSIVKKDKRKPWDDELVKEIFNTAVLVVREYRSDDENKSLQRKHEQSIRMKNEGKGKKRKYDSLGGDSEIVVNVETELEIEL